MKEGSVFLYRLYVCCSVVSARVYVYACCHGVQVSMDYVHPLPLHCSKEHVYKVYVVSVLQI
jgi:hypothetical protein